GGGRNRHDAELLLSEHVEPAIDTEVPSGNVVDTPTLHRVNVIGEQQVQRMRGQQRRTEAPGAREVQSQHGRVVGEGGDGEPRIGHGVLLMPSLSDREAATLLDAARADEAAGERVEGVSDDTALSSGRLCGSGWRA